MPPLLKKTTKTNWLLIVNSILLLGLLHAFPAWSDNLEQLRASGMIGENTNGFVVAREPSVQGEVDAINAKRKTIYQEKAAAQGISADQVGKVYASEIFKKVPAGTWIQLNGQWVKK
ncbi:MAG: YdbL family protein [Nitrosomonas sp.]|nr:YdbL family protein [Nitrosomonas sp.]